MSSVDDLLFIAVLRALAERFSGPDAPFELANRGNSIAVTVKLSQEDTLLGKWVASDGRVGVVAALPSKGQVELHLVGWNGQTTGTQVVDAATIVPAAWDEIPPPRRPGRQAAETARK